MHILNSFIHKTKIYNQVLNMSDDSILLIEAGSGDIVLIAGSGGVCKKSNDEIVGSFKLEQNDHWSFTTKDSKEYKFLSKESHYENHETLIDLELDVFKWYVSQLTKEGK